MSAEFESLFQKAREAGLVAARAATPTPMVLRESTIGFGADGKMTDIPTGPTYVVEDGPCGFAWVRVRPGTSSFAKWLIKSGRGKSDSYAGGVTIWVHLPTDIDPHGQSMVRKEAYAMAFAEVLTGAGIRAFADSRMD